MIKLNAGNGFIKSLWIYFLEKYNRMDEFICLICYWLDEIIMCYVYSLKENEKITELLCMLSIFYKLNVSELLLYDTQIVKPPRICMHKSPYVSKHYLFLFICKRKINVLIKIKHWKYFQKTFSIMPISDYFITMFTIPKRKTSEIYISVKFWIDLIMSVRLCVWVDMWC